MNSPAVANIAAVVIMAGSSIGKPSCTDARTGTGFGINIMKTGELE
jgi:hypothetical protein